MEWLATLLQTGGSNTPLAKCTVDNVAKDGVRLGNPCDFQTFNRETNMTA